MNVMLSHARGGRAGVWFSLGGGGGGGVGATHNAVDLQLGSTNRSNFGLAKSGYMLGYLKNATIKNATFLHMISGAGWLVRKYVIQRSSLAGVYYVCCLCRIVVLHISTLAGIRKA